MNFELGKLYHSLSWLKPKMRGRSPIRLATSWHSMRCARLMVFVPTGKLPESESGRPLVCDLFVKPRQDISSHQLDEDSCMLPDWGMLRYDMPKSRTGLLALRGHYFPARWPLSRRSQSLANLDFVAAAGGERFI
jgi:hypothetical protein